MQPKLSAAPIAKRYLRTQEAATYTGLSISFFNNARCTGDGPPFIRASDKARGTILYSVDDLDSWLLARRRTSTSAAPA